MWGPCPPTISSFHHFPSSLMIWGSSQHKNYLDRRKNFLSTFENWKLFVSGKVVNLWSLWRNMSASFFLEEMFFPPIFFGKVINPRSWWGDVNTSLFLPPDSCGRKDASEAASPIAGPASPDVLSVSLVKRTPESPATDKSRLRMKFTYTRKPEQRRLDNQRLI